MHCATVEPTQNTVTAMTTIMLHPSFSQAIMNPIAELIRTTYRMATSLYKELVPLRALQVIMMALNATSRHAQAVLAPPCRAALKRVPHRNRSVSAAAAVGTVDTSYVNSDSGVRPFEDIPGPVNLPIVGTLWQYKLGE